MTRTLYADPSGLYVHDVVLNSCRRFAARTAIVDNSSSEHSWLTYTQPMGGVIMRTNICETFMNAPEYAASIFHGYTYSAHPIAVAAALAATEVLVDEGMNE